MLDTLIKIGKWQATKMKPIERFLSKPKLKDDKKYFVLNLIFDLDKHQIFTKNLKEFDITKDSIDFLLLKILPGNNKAIYATVEKPKINNLIKSYFGKIDKDSLNKVNHGELYLKMKEKNAESKLLNLLDDITKLKDFLKEKIRNNKGKLDAKILIKDLTLNKNEDFAIVISSIKSKKYGFETPQPIAKIESYKKFIENYFITDNKQEKNENKLCYATGDISDDVQELKLENRYSLNKMFVTETKNYASAFNEKNFVKNYQTSKKNQQYLDIASTYLLNNYKINIAGINHVMIPTFFSKTNIDFDFALNKINKKSDFLFKYNDIKKRDTNITDEIDNDIYWLNFLSIDSDGNYFKSTDLIKDVSKPYFLKIIKCFNEINSFFSEKYNSKTFFNFYSLYKYIPVKTGINKNEALELFKDIFEHRIIEKNRLYRHFIKYLIVQRSGQFDNKGTHRSYKNISEQNNFDFAVKNAIIHYFALIKLLKKLNLININNMNTMEQNNSKTNEVKQDFGKRIEIFFTEMEYSDAQKALFYLGRALDQVAYAQYKKNHKNKPVLSKLNYNGMDKDNIIRLRLDLAEKARQYNIVNKIEFDFAKFTELFNPNNSQKWLSAEENVFYILSGYSFGLMMDNASSDNGNTTN